MIDDVSVALRLEEMPCDAMDAVLSFLSFSDYRTLSSLSVRMNDAVSKASHLLMDESTGRPAEYTNGASESSSLKPPVQPKATAPLRLNQLGLTKLMKRYICLNVLQLEGLAAVGDDLFRILNESTAASTIHILSLNGVSLTYWCTESTCPTCSTWPFREDRFGRLWEN
jgi:hypothetical protein